ncbi:MAG: hypothetical protein KJN90_04320 [Gammaproteobacteria bacterium]|nr:hypothetical protein [Gammaproteobacteria bacterium]
MFCRLLTPLIVLLIPAASVLAQSSLGDDLPRTEHGFPDMQGYWTNASQTPLQRPSTLGSKRYYNADEVEEIEAEALQQDRQKTAPLAASRELPQKGGTIRFQADENFANTRINLMQVNGEHRTSLIVDPADGRLPFQEGWQQNEFYSKWLTTGAGQFDGPEMRSPWERCFFVGGQLPPMIAWTYNANFQIVQTQDYVMIMREMAHDARIIRLDGKPFPEQLYQWSGNSAGYWEGDTLVVNSKGFHPQSSHLFIRSSQQLEISERFELISDQEIFYQYTVTDPGIYSRPFTVEMTLSRKAPGEAIYEYACHEGNYSLPGILAGARRGEVESLLNATED